MSTKIFLLGIKPRLVSLGRASTYSVEKKMNGFHVSIHKQKETVKIFSNRKEDLTSSLPTLSEAIKKLSKSDFILDGDLVFYENEKVLGRNILIEYLNTLSSEDEQDDKNIKLHVCDIVYFNKQLTELNLFERIDFLKKLNFNNRVLEIERKLSNKEDLKKNVELVLKLPNSKGVIVKNMDSIYSFEEQSNWKKFIVLNELNVIVLKVIPKERELFNYLVGIPATEKYLDQNYIQDKKLVLGHTFISKQKFNEGDKIQILVEEAWKHEKDTGIHYSIYKPRVKEKTNELVSNVDKLENMVNLINKIKEK